MQYKEIAADGTYVLKRGSGFLRGVQVNLPGSGTIQIFDNDSAAAPAIAGATAFALPAAGTYLRYGCTFNTGLTVVIGSMTTGSVTVSFY